MNSDAFYKALTQYEEQQKKNRAYRKRRLKELNGSDVENLIEIIVELEIRIKQLEEL